SPGDPLLPARIVMVAVPPSGAVTVSAYALGTEAHEGVRLARISRTRRSDQGSMEFDVSGPALDAAVQTPPTPARLLDVWRLRDQGVGGFLITPVVYDPRDRRMSVHRRIEVEVRMEGASSSTTIAGSPRADTFEPIYRDALVNYEQGRGWRRDAS